MSQYAPKGVKSLCITSSQTVYVKKPDFVSCKTQERLGGRLICEIYLNTYFQRARLEGRFICEIGLYVSIYVVFMAYMYTKDTKNFHMPSTQRGENGKIFGYCNTKISILLKINVTSGEKLQFFFCYLSLCVLYKQKI